MKHFYKISLVLILVSILAGAFYWYQLRPSQAKKFCTHWAVDKAKDGDERYNDDGYIHYYQRCMRERGI